MNDDLSNFGFGDWLHFDAAEQATLVLAHAAVAGAEAIGSARRLGRRVERFAPVLAQENVNERILSDYLVSVAENDSGWRNLLAQRGESLSVERSTLLTLSVCTFPVFVELDDIAASAAVRRMDAVLDLWNVDECSYEVQQAFVTTVQEMLGGRDSDGEHLRALASGARPMAEMLTMFHPVLGFAATQGLARISKPSERPESPESDDLAGDQGREIARAVLACRSLMAEPIRHSEVTNIRDSMLKRAQACSNQVEVDYLTSGAAALSTIVGSSADADALPDLVGRDLAWAKSTLRKLGVPFTVSDGHASQNRLIVSEANWIVRHVRRSEQAVHLSVLKRTDPPGSFAAAAGASVGAAS
jgi:hypothetical protein